MAEEIISASAVPSPNNMLKKGAAINAPTGAEVNKFSDAERRLREELAAFKLK